MALTKKIWNIQVTYEEKILTVVTHTFTLVFI